MRKLVLLVCLASCGDVEALPGPDAAADVDGAPGRRCDPTKDFGTPEVIADFRDDQISDQDGRLSADGRILVFTREFSAMTGHNLDLFMAVRASPDAPWGEPSEAAFAALKTPLNQRAPQLSADGLTLYYTNSVSGVGYDIMTASRGSELAPFSAPELVAGVNSPSKNDRDPYFLPDASAVYWVSERDSMTYKIYRAERLTGGTFGNVERLSYLESGEDELMVSPVVTPDERVIYWGSTRPGGQGGDDIYRATRAGAGEPFDDIVNLATLNTVATDVPTWISADDCVMVLRSERPDNATTLSHLFVARRPE